MIQNEERRPGVGTEAADEDQAKSLGIKVPEPDPGNNEGQLRVRALTEAHAVALRHARHLIEQGVPVFIAKPDVTGGVWNPIGGRGGTGYWLPPRWQSSQPDLSVIDRWRPGDALCAVTGVVVDLVDVDPRNGGTPSRNGLMKAGMWPISYGAASTPSGGSHDWVRCLGVASMDGVCAGVDVKAGMPDGSGRGFGFIAPTARMSKTTGEIVPYLWTVAPDLDAIWSGDDSGEGIADMIGSARHGQATDSDITVAFELPEIIPHGARDVCLFKYACSLRWRGTSRSDATMLMRKAWLKCEQPEGDLYTEADAMAKIDRVWDKYEPAGARFRAAAPPDNSEQGRQGDLHRGQLLMAGKLATSYADLLMFVYGLGWYYWTGRVWERDQRGAAARAVHEVLGSALVYAMDRKDDELKADVHRCESANAINGILVIAATLAPFARTVSDLDSDPHLLNVANGTLDLRTREIRSHNPADRITKITRAAYRPDTDRSVWEQFLHTVLPNAGVREYLQRLLGVGLLGVVIEHILAILTGTGANGKGTFYKAVLWALGDYASTAEPELFMHRDGAHPTGEMDLLGRRVIVVSESDKDRQLAEATMKRLTGGDTVKARHMRQDFVEFAPSHLPLLITNHLPKVSGDDPAIWRRVRVIPFAVTFTDAEQDRGLEDRLRLAADAVLTWMVDGYAQYGSCGLNDPDAVLVATRAYHLDSDALGRFIRDRCRTGPQLQHAVGPLFDAWTAWCVDDGTEPGTKKAFGSALERRGYAEVRTNTARFRRGIHVRADGDLDQGD